MNTNKNQLLRIIYGGVGLILILIAVSIPQLINRDADFNDYTVAKEVLQEIIIAALVAALWIAAKFYQKNLDQLRKIRRLQLNKNELEASLFDAVKHIGSVNIQLETVRSSLSLIKNYPKNKADFKKVLVIFAQKVLTLANVDWVMLRLINIDSQRTLREHTETRGNQVLLRPSIDNKDLIKQQIKDCQLIVSGQEDLSVKLIAVIPDKKLKSEELALIQALLGQLEMIFIIFTSKYYRDDCFKNNKKSLSNKK